MFFVFFIYFFLTITEIFIEGSPFTNNKLIKDVRTSIKPLNPLFKKFKGFYGLIGPDVNKTNVDVLYDLFTGDGIIQGVFFQEENITFVKHYVRTEKIVHESIHGRFSKHILMTPFYVLLNKLGLIPNVLGLANTAISKFSDNIFALFERDYPYQIGINFENQTVSTVKKIHIQGLEHFSGHSKVVSNMSREDSPEEVHSIDYEVICKTVDYYRFSQEFNQIKKIKIKTKYIPIVHDFIVSKNKFFLLDAPFKWDWTQKIPVVFDKRKPSYIYLYDNTENILRKIPAKPPGFYIFHYADIEEINNKTNIYAPVYDNIDFSSLNISGKYRKITIQEDSLKIFKNPFLENMNLDFPQKWRSYVILRGIKYGKISEFVVCKGLSIIKKIRLPENRFFCGEHSLVEIEGRPYLVGFSYDRLDKGYICIIGVFTEEYAEEDLVNSVTIGFHSIYLSCYNYSLSSIS
jgi:hypothetical protein